MSDINLRFDGLILLLALAMGMVIYFVIAIVALAVALAHPVVRAWKVSASAAAMGIVSLAIVWPLFLYWDRHGPAVWADQLTYPWILVFVAGCWFLVRIR